MGKRNAITKKLGCILLVVAIMFAGNSSVVYGGLLKNVPPKFVINIGKVKTGMTKQEVKNLLGNPNDTFTATNPNGHVSESWSYGGVSYDSLSNPIMGHIVDQTVLSGLGLIISQLPYGALVGLGGSGDGNRYGNSTPSSH